jgi:hypothetical protein
MAMLNNQMVAGTFGCSGAAPEIAVPAVPNRWAVPGEALHASPGEPCANPRGANLTDFRWGKAIWLVVIIG